jgi:hypothetical protein
MGFQYLVNQNLSQSISIPSQALDWARPGSPEGERPAPAAHDTCLRVNTWVCLVVGQLGRDRPLTSSLVPLILRDNREQHWIVLSQPLTQNQTT